MTYGKAYILSAVVVVALLGGAACSTGGGGRAVRFRAHDYAYVGLENLAVHTGDKVTFTMANDGPADHEFEVFGPDGKAIDEIAPVHEGKTGRLTVTFSRPGTYTFVCGVSDHEQRGMKGSFVVA